MDESESASDMLFTYASEVRSCTRRVRLNQLRTECALVDAYLPMEVREVEAAKYAKFNDGLPLKDPEFDDFSTSLKVNEKYAELNELLRLELQQNMKFDGFLNLAQRAGMALQHTANRAFERNVVSARDDFAEVKRCEAVLDEIDQLSQQVRSRLLGFEDTAERDVADAREMRLNDL